MLPRNNELSPLASLVKERLGGLTTVREFTVNVTASRLTLLQNNPNRLSWFMINEGIYEVRVSTDPNVSGVSGWVLTPMGGIIISTYDEDGENVGQEVFGIGVFSTVRVRIREVVRL